MAFVCRLCGPKTFPRDQVVFNLNSEIDGVGFRELISMFTRVTFDDDPNYPQDVCETCKTTIFKFIEFCERIGQFQKTLKQSSFLKPDIEPSYLNQIMEPETNSVNILLSDEDLDSPLTHEESSSSHSNTSAIPPQKRIVDFKLKQCSVHLEILPLIYVRSDSETDSTDEEERTKCKILKSVKRELDSSGELMSSPQKRMKIAQCSSAEKKKVMTILPFSPMLKEEPKPKPILNLIQQSSPLFNGLRDSEAQVASRYKEIFKVELNQTIDESTSNLNVPLSAKLPDGRVNDDYAKIFYDWNSVQLKCGYRSCTQKQFSGYELLLHRQSDHKDDKQGNYSCPLCHQPPALDSFYKFYQHVIDHYRYMKYE